MKSLTLAALAAVLSAGPSAVPALGQSLQPGDRLAICGDSITEQHIYSADIEAYLACCRPVANVTAEQFGWSGETAPGFHQKMPQFMLPFGNTVATTCYGMNDGHYLAMSPETGDAYRAGITNVVESLKSAGYRFIVVGSSGPVDTTTFRKPSVKSAVYNQTLAALRDIDREVAQKEGVAFADLFSTMTDVMAKAKAKYGDKYPVCGRRDGIHPDANGHLVMAYAFLKALGVSGDIGTITVDLAGHEAAATDGHKVLGMDAGTVQVESTRYPFCFNGGVGGDPASPDATIGIIEFLPFNQDLNRLKLVVTNPGAQQLKVTFGPATKTFAAADLAKGINLAAEFLDNPFSEPFAAVLKKVQVKQAIETAMDKNFYNNLAAYEKAFPEAKAAYENVQPAIRDLLSAQAKAVADAVRPVRYTIKIETTR